MNDTLFAAVESAAFISSCGLYRYWLTRTWDKAKPPVCWIMLNPSTADANVDDPTIRRCVGFAKSWGAGGIVVVNLFAYRATNPDDVWASKYPIGPENDAHIIAACASRRIIAAWGTLGNTNGRDDEVRELLSGRAVECLGVTKDGHPRHPLYVKADVTPVELAVATAGGRHA